MITEDYVSFETAKLLKEKGFDESCERIYDEGGYLLANNCGYINEESPDEYFHALAPTLQMAMKWLREEHNAFITISRSITGNGYVYSHEIYNGGIAKYAQYGRTYPTYEEAVEAAIKYCLENLI